MERRVIDPPGATQPLSDEEARIQFPGFPPSDPSVSWNWKIYYLQLKVGAGEQLSNSLFAQHTGPF